MRIMLAGDLIDRPRHLFLTPRQEVIGGIMLSQRPYDLTRLFIDDDGDIGVAGINQNIVGIEALVAG